MSELQFLTVNKRADKIWNIYHEEKLLGQVTLSEQTPVFIPLSNGNYTELELSEIVLIIQQMKNKNTHYHVK